MGKVYEPEYPKGMYLADVTVEYARNGKHEEEMAAQGWSPAYIPSRWPKMLFHPSKKDKHGLGLTRIVGRTLHLREAFLSDVGDEGQVVYRRRNPEGDALKRQWAAEVERLVEEGWSTEALPQHYGEAKDKKVLAFDAPLDGKAPAAPAASGEVETLRRELAELRGAVQAKASRPARPSRPRKPKVAAD